MKKHSLRPFCDECFVKLPKDWTRRPRVPQNSNSLSQTNQCQKQHLIDSFVEHIYLSGVPHLSGQTRFSKKSQNWTVVVSQWQSTCLVTVRSWVQNLPGTGFFLFSILSTVPPLSGPSQGCNTTDFLKKYAQPCSLGRSKLNTHGLRKNIETTLRQYCCC